MAKLSKAVLATALLLAIIPAIADEQAKSVFEQDYTAYQQALDANLSDRELAALAEQAYLSGIEYFGADDISTAILKINYLTLLNNDAVRSERSQQLAGEILAVSRKEYGQNAPELIDALLVALSTHNLEATKDYYEELVTIADAHIEQQPEHMLRAKIEAAAHLLRIGSPVSRDLVRFADTAEERFGAEHELALLANFHAGRYLEARKEQNEAIKRFKKVAAADESKLPSALVTAKYMSHARLVYFLEQQGKSDEATAHCLAIAKMGYGIQDEREPTPLYRVNPRYPRLLVQRRVEGEIKVSYDIDELGFVQNAQVLESSNSGFTKTGLEALEQWRFAPRVVDGEPVATTGRTVKLQFQIK
ncbi:hypothetical protein IDSA_05735 [Pseudidiomarina salinarum]|uniref:Protein TonB n=1 Tax=Pseudidiomarina salinarum TaxID=435908 RepID=A0A094IW59_9GAMM|nr:energy transducer TonB [Pseudidiomarina salinarum]KFZ30089.1 hypothetical protein IDSA_05735 [Pseudidiomarina salinarum]RUO70060.1 energy transducer TonB [Pseudidiomarina salinarum]